jgi:hypothetical protein
MRAPLSRLVILFALAASLTACSYKEPAAEVPHALVIGTFLKANGKSFGYWPKVVLCKGRKARGECKSEVRTMNDGRVKFRVPVGKEITVGPVGLLSIEAKNGGNLYTYCHGEPLTVVPKRGDVYEFTYLYVPKKGCGAVWDQGVPQATSQAME